MFSKLFNDYFSVIRIQNHSLLGLWIFGYLQVIQIDIVVKRLNHTQLIQQVLTVIFSKLCFDGVDNSLKLVFLLSSKLFPDVLYLLQDKLQQLEPFFYFLFNACIRLGMLL